MQIYYTQVDLEAGFDLLATPRDERLLQGRTISSCSGLRLFESLRGQPIKCWECGCEADRWIAERGKNDHQKGSPVLNLYAVREGKLVMMTRDHIIPRSLGGVDDIANLRPGCSVCNELRGNNVTPDDIAFRTAHPELVSSSRYQDGRLAARRAWYREGVPMREKQKACASFVLIDPDFMRWVIENPIHIPVPNQPPQPKKKPKVIAGGMGYDTGRGK